MLFNKCLACNTSLSVVLLATLVDDPINFIMPKKKEKENKKKNRKNIKVNPFCQSDSLDDLWIDVVTKWVSAVR